MNISNPYYYVKFEGKPSWTCGHKHRLPERAMQCLNNLNCDLGGQADLVLIEVKNIPSRDKMTVRECTLTLQGDVHYFDGLGDSMW